MCHTLIRFFTFDAFGLYTFLSKKMEIIARACHTAPAYAFLSVVWVAVMVLETQARISVLQ
jgi:hypothetical protein